MARYRFPIPFISRIGASGVCQFWPEKIPQILKVMIYGVVESENIAAVGQIDLILSIALRE